MGSIFQRTGILPPILLPGAAKRYLAMGHTASDIHFLQQLASCTQYCHQVLPNGILQRGTTRLVSIFGGNWYLAAHIVARCCQTVSCNGARRDRHPFFEATGILPWILLPDAAHRYLATGHVANGIHFSGQPTSCPLSTGFHTVFLVVLVQNGGLEARCYRYLRVDTPCGDVHHVN